MSSPTNYEIGGKLEDLLSRIADATEATARAVEQLCEQNTERTTCQP